ncbi:MAG: cysteine desulfurase family protein [Alphaproteobacteria bacterium]
MVYLDNNASMVPYGEVLEALNENIKNSFNAGSVHTMGRNSRAKIEKARLKIADMMGCNAEDVLFTSGATESNNIAIMGGGETIALVGALEHPSVLNVHPNTHIIPVDRNGIVDLEFIENFLKDKKAGDVLVSVMYASHETGTLQPIKAVAKICAKYMQRFHVDAVQGAGKRKIDFISSGANSMSITAHKIGGVQGVGALIYNRALNLNPLMRGGGQEKQMRPGTVNVAGCVSFGVACDICVDTMDEKTEKLDYLRDYMESEITARCPRVEIVAKDVDRLTGTSRIIMPNVNSEKQVMFMDLKGICVASGSACSSGVVKESGALRAMGYDKSCIGSSIRIGMSFATSKDEIDKFIKIYCDMYDKMAK